MPRNFNDDCIDRLVVLSTLPDHANLLTFKTEIQRAASIYLRESEEPSGNDRRKEAAALYRAASRREFTELKAILYRLSNLTHDELNKRGGRFPQPASLPDSAILDDPTRRDEACETVVTLSTHGGRWIEGRKRPSGRRSRTWEPLLCAPEAQSHPQRRQCERTFVMWLQLAWLDAVETAPALTAATGREGPFVKLVRECLRLVGAREADAVGLINDVHAFRLGHRERRMSGTKA